MGKSSFDIQLKVLLVDDNPEFISAAQRLLSLDPEIRIVGKASSGEQALKMLNEQRPDLVLLDIAMPGLNGLETAKKIKEGTTVPKIIILTLYENAEYRDVAKTLSLDGFISKTDFGTKLYPLIQEFKLEKQAYGRNKEKSMKTILLVDDSSTMRRMVKASLQSIPHTDFREAANGLEAIEKVAIEPVSLMVLDLNMPDMHGLEVLKFLRSHEKYKSLPVIVLTTRGDETSRDAALAAGATLYWTKPFNPGDFNTRVRQLLGGLK